MTHSTKTYVEFIPHCTSESSVVMQVNNRDTVKALALLPDAECFFFYNETETRPGSNIREHTEHSGFYFPGAEIKPDPATGEPYLLTRYGIIRDLEPGHVVLDESGNKIPSPALQPVAPTLEL